MNGNSVFLIAEIAQAHDGSLGIAHSYIDALGGTGVNAIKFQTHIAEAESSIHEPFRIPFSYEDKTRFDYWKRTGFTLEQWKGLKEHCDAAGLEFMSSAFSQEAVDWLEEIGVRRHKIASGEVSNFLMLEKIGRTGKPVILSSGMSSFHEIETAVCFLENCTTDISILQCTTAYPTPPEKIGLNVISELKQKFPGKKIGLSDHSGVIWSALAAVALGAEILEFHAVFDKRMFGPDAKSSLTINEISTLVQGVRFLEIALANPVDKSGSDGIFADLKTMFGKSLSVNRDLPAGHALSFGDLETKKPADMGISASRYKDVLGKPLLAAKSMYDYLREEDIHAL